MIKFRYLLALMLLASCIFGLFQVKFKVQNLDREMNELKQQLAHEKETIHVLKAEWAYLNQPERLQRLAEKFLDLTEVKHDQLMLTQAGSMIIAVAPVQPQIKEQDLNPIVKVSYQSSPSNLTNKVKWHYKARPVIGSGRKK